MPISAWFLVFFGFGAFAACYFVVEREEIGPPESRQRARFCAEVSLPTALLFWLMFRAAVGWLPVGYGWYDDALGLAVLMPDVACCMLAWAIVVWRLEAVLGVPPWRTHEIATKVCLAMGAGLGLTGAPAVLVYYLDRLGG